MTIDEQKIISNISEESGGLKDYNSFLRFSDKYQLKRRQRKLIIMIIVLLFYFFGALVALFFFKNDYDLLSWPLSAQPQNQQINDLQARTENLEKEIGSFQKIFASSVNSNMAIGYLNSQFDKLDKKQTALEESISLDPEKALTAALLREKQKNLEDNFAQLRDAQNKLDSKLDTFITTVILAPIMVALLGLLGWFLKGKFDKKSS